MAAAATCFAQTKLAGGTDPQGGARPLQQGYRFCARQTTFWGLRVSFSLMSIWDGNICYLTAPWTAACGCKLPFSSCLCVLLAREQGCGIAFWLPCHLHTSGAVAVTAVLG
jgi:hypothetical protein